VPHQSPAPVASHCRSGSFLQEGGGESERKSEGESDNERKSESESEAGNRQPPVTPISQHDASITESERVWVVIGVENPHEARA